MRDETALNVTLLAGGVGGAKMAEGLAALDDIALTIIGNVADDDAFHGLWVSPDIDTLTYSLAGMINRQQGWGLADEGTRALDILTMLGEDTWMMLGDKDFGLHIYRTMRRAKGDRPSEIARDVAKAFGVKPTILLPTDDQVQTKVRIDEGWISFQDYFVRRKCAPEVLELKFDGIKAARPTEEALSALAGADLIIVAPSNPLVSIAPILETPGIREALTSAPAPKIAVSPFIAGKVVKGPADRMMAALGLRADAVGVADRYADWLDCLVIDHQDEALSEEIASLGVKSQRSNILMKDLADKARLGRETVDFGREQLKEGRAA
ncbi:2-phospho-L-lactate transferase [uncultured Cohaesibacter sp.]|uniref:2-phospho-L-lactate transferase n=1 Tax=uncultured Cohaesibacter sp. TaxID=1002546 RepID=UPI0029C8E682|nr:2-phospho-L-lactate transferase [uncultured Cohaesibacter sp.]